MTTTNRAASVNPLVLACGPAPLSIFSVIVVPADPVMAAGARSLAADYHVELGRCLCCGSEISENVVGESAARIGQTPRRWVVCRPCIRAHGGVSLNKKLAYMDHTSRKFPGTGDF